VAALELTRSIASKCAKERLNVVSGGARGVDAAAMQGVTEAGGYCIGVLASDLLKTSVNRQNRTGLQEGRFGPRVTVLSRSRLQRRQRDGRNRYIYALADQALVIDSALRSGGTWEGAIENLEQGWVPLYERTPGDGPGMRPLSSREVRRSR
jgi:predicted Rossmann fold nucleotide-binding protein DprA/Smf involved in DNA uptake